MSRTRFATQRDLEPTQAMFSRVLPSAFLI